MWSVPTRQPDEHRFRPRRFGRGAGPASSLLNGGGGGPSLVPTSHDRLLSTIHGANEATLAVALVLTDWVGFDSPLRLALGRNGPRRPGAFESLERCPRHWGQAKSAAANALKGGFWHKGVASCLFAEANFPIGTLFARRAAHGNYPCVSTLPQATPNNSRQATGAPVTATRNLWGGSRATAVLERSSSRQGYVQKQRRWQPVTAKGRANLAGPPTCGISPGGGAVVVNTASDAVNVWRGVGPRASKK